MTADARSAERQIARNVAVHDRIARKYDALHSEIFNEIEQARLRSMLEKARDAVRTGADPIEALDFGCGSGNLSRHLLDLGVDVTAADVSEGFLALVRNRYPTSRLKALLMNGRDLANVADDRFDLIATYSVLHHIPDYLGAVRELARVCKPSGVVMIDHEQNEQFWSGDPVYDEFRKQALRFDWRKYLRPSNYLHRARRLFDPRHSNEGDIHVWSDDHIDWAKIKRVMSKSGFEIAIEEDYLLYRKLYRRDVYERYAGCCTDTKCIVFRKLLPTQRREAMGV